MKKLLMAFCIFSPFVGCLADTPGTWPGYTHGIGIGGWLTNYKRFNVLPEKWRLSITIGDLEHFDTYITEVVLNLHKAVGNYCDIPEKTSLMDDPDCL